MAKKSTDKVVQQKPGLEQADCDEANGNAALMEVEVACATADLQQVISLKLSEGSSIGDAVTRSGILALFPTLDADKTKFGIYGKIEPIEKVLKQGDRVEVYRPLLITPMEARRLRAKRKKAVDR